MIDPVVLGCMIATPLVVVAGGWALARKPWRRR